MKCILWNTWKYILYPLGYNREYSFQFLGIKYFSRKADPNFCGLLWQPKQPWSLSGLERWNTAYVCLDWGGLFLPFASLTFPYQQALPSFGTVLEKNRISHSVFIVARQKNWSQSYWPPEPVSSYTFSFWKRWDKQQPHYFGKTKYSFLNAKEAFIK